MSKNKRDNIKQQLVALQDKITLLAERDRIERLLEQADDPDIPRPKPFELLHHRGQLNHLQQQEAHLQKRLANLDRLQEEPQKSVWDHFYDARDTMEHTADKLEAARDSAASWYRKHWPSHYAEQEQLTDGQLAKRQMDRTIAKNFPEHHQQQQQDKKIQARIAKEHQRYLTDNERRNARDVRKQSREARQGLRAQQRLELERFTQKANEPEIKLEAEHNWQQLKSELDTINQEIAEQREPERDR